MKTYKLTKQDIKELNKQTVHEMVKELDKLLNKRSRHHENTHTRHM